MAAVHHHHHHHFVFPIFFLLLSISLTKSLPDGDVLLKFKQSITDPDEALSSWDSNVSPCDPVNPWLGVFCADVIISTIDLGGMSLSGEPDVAPLEILGGLRSLSFENNNFSGPIPQFNRLVHLKALYIQNNQFSGEIPSSFFNSLGSVKKIWLAGNKFSGPIPTSMSDLLNLRELHLESNEFSGSIPSFKDTSDLKSFNLSHNKLEGSIPESLSNYSEKSFQGNPGLCGQPLKTECKSTPPPPNGDSPVSSPQNDSSSSQTKWVLLGIVIALLFVTVFFKSKQKEDHFSVLGKENLDEVVHMQIPSNNRRSFNAARKSANLNNDTSSNHGGSRRGIGGVGGGSSHGGQSVGELVVINEEKGIFGLPDLMRAAAEVLGNGGLGSAYKAMMTNGVSVVVKRLREMNKMSRDTFDMEVRKLGKLRHKNILTPLAYHYRKEEKLLVSEHMAKGSLLFVLHDDRGISHAELNWPNRLRIVQGVARGMGFLHTEFATYDVPHGNLKSSNIVLSRNYEPLLTDYAFYPLINHTQTAQCLFAFKSPEAILYQQVSHKSDVYCLGIVILEIVTGKYPSQYLNNQKDGTDVVQWVQTAVAEKREAELIDPEILSGATTESVVEMEKLLHIGVDCTESDVDSRIDMKEAIKRIEEIQI